MKITSTTHAAMAAPAGAAAVTCYLRHVLPTSLAAYGAAAALPGTFRDYL